MGDDREKLSAGNEEMSDEQMDVVVMQIRRISRDATLQYALNIGRIVI